MRYAYLIIRIAFMPLVLFWLLAIAIPKALIWALDCDYDHDALVRTNNGAIEWLRNFLHGV